MKYFRYEREAQVDKKNAEGNVIPIFDAEGKPTGKNEKETVYYDDYFNLNKVIRTHQVNDEQILILLDDGHEVTELIPQLKNSNKAPHPSNIIEVKQRSWVQSEILIKGEDQIGRLFDALDKA